MNRCFFTIPHSSLKIWSASFLVGFKMSAPIPSMRALHFSSVSFSRTGTAEARVLAALVVTSEWLLALAALATAVMFFSERVRPRTRMLLVARLSLLVVVDLILQESLLGQVALVQHGS